MPLPETIMQQVGQEAPRSSGWSFGLISFSAGILFIVLFIWAGLVFGYKPYLDNQTAQIQDQISQENQLISPTDQASLINYYSQISNVRTLLSNRENLSGAFRWLEQNTEPNVYYSSFSITAGGQLALILEATSEADANQQIAIFESSPQVSALTISGVNLSSQANLWESNITMTLDPSVFANATTTP